MAAKSSKSKTPVEENRLGRELVGLFAILCALLLLLSLATFDSRDPWLNHVVSGVSSIHNRAGLFGAYTGGLLYDVLGLAAWVVPAFFCLVGARRILSSPSWDWWRWFGFLLVAVCIAIAGAAHDLQNLQGASGPAGQAANHGGGLLGHLLYRSLVGWLSVTGTTLIWVFCLMLSLQMLFGFSWISPIAGVFLRLWETLTTRARNGFADRAGSARSQNQLTAKTMGEDLEEDAALTFDVHSLQAAPTADSIENTTDTEYAAIAFHATDEFRIPRDARPVNDEEEQSSFSTVAEHFSESAQEAPIIAGEPQAPYSMLPEPALVHPALHSPKPGGNEELPPWVVDFESDRIGKQPENAVVDKYAVSVAAAPEAAGAENIDALAGADILAAQVQQKSVQHLSGIGAVPGTKAPDGFQNAKAATSNMSASQQPAVVSVQEREEIPPADAAPAPGIVKQAISLVRKKARVPLPPLDLLGEVPAAVGRTPREALEAKGRSLMTCLTDFGIQGELVGITPGPVVTMFEVRPAPGVRVSRIANLSDDLALALKAVAVRIQAPVPGTDTVGIEIPNDVRETVHLRELIGARAFNDSKSLLTLALGKDIAGRAAVADLATMPHLLVAGATGAGKSVGINSIILSLIYKARPDEVKLLLVDPKRVEMAIYADLPHLVHPVVTDMPLAKNALEWAVKEMERRYEDIAKAGVRNIADYNAKLATLGDSRPDGMEGLEFMPYMVIIIDELADLMLVGAKEVETSIVRLAQLARAAGVHLILATQRPSVDVVTGLIKANFPCRISFQVTSKHDSRTILDTVGAEHLLGKGDMLFKPGGGKFQRMHGAFVSDNTVQAVADYWRSHLAPDYRVDFSDWGAQDSGDFGGFSGNGGGDIASDPMYLEATEFVRQQGKASISLIQRKFRIGFNKAARLIEQMEQDGIVGPADGSKPRLVIR